VASLPKSTTLTDLLEVVRIGRTDAALFAIADGDNVLFDSEYAVFHVLLRGQALLQTNAVSVALSPGDAAVLVRGAEHRVGAKQNRSASLVHRFDPRPRRDTIPLIRTGYGAQRTLLLSGGFDISYTHRSPLFRQLPGIIFLENALSADPTKESGFSNVGSIEKSCHGPGAAVFAARLADLLLVQSIRSRVIELEHWLRSDDKMSVTSSEIYAAIALIHARPDFDWKVADLAREVGMSRSSFAAGFTQSMGCSPMRYIRQYRVERAKHLLSSTALSVSQVAREMGYATEETFSKMFRRVCGHRPSHERHVSAT